MDTILRSLLNNCLELLAQNNKQLLRDNICDILDILDNGIYDEIPFENDDVSDCDSVSSCESDDCPFTDLELSYIKNNAHYDYLIRYSLVPTFPYQYYKPFMDNCKEEYLCLHKL